VENTGSIAGDILTTDRTFLAWARTELGFVGAGSALLPPTTDTIASFNKK